MLHGGVNRHRSSTSEVNKYQYQQQHTNFSEEQPGKNIDNIDICKYPNCNMRNCRVRMAGQKLNGAQTTPLS